MKKLLPLAMLLMTASAANAGGLVTKHASSVQLTVDAARSTATRVGSSYAISGSGVNTTDGTTAGTISTGTISSGLLAPGNIAATQAQMVTHFHTVSLLLKVMLSQPSAAPTVGAVPNFSSLTSYTAGDKTGLAGTVSTSGALTVTAGGLVLQQQDNS